MNKKQCEHKDEYPVAVFMAGQPWVWLTCEDCGTNRVVSGDFANDQED